MARLPMRLVVSKQNPLSEKDKVAPADYKDEDFILLSHDMLERKLTDTLTPDLTEDQVVGEISSTQVALRMVKETPAFTLRTF